MPKYRVSAVDHLSVRGGEAGPGETVRLTREQAAKINSANPGCISEVGGRPQEKAKPKALPPGRHRYELDGAGRARLVESEVYKRKG